MPRTSSQYLAVQLRSQPAVDEVVSIERAGALASRSLKTESKQRALDLLISMVDLTSLEGTDTPERVRSLAAKALRPDPLDPSTPAVAAVCVYPDMVEHVRRAVGGKVAVASVAGAFPSGRSSLGVKLLDTRDALNAGADEIDMVIDRGAFLSGEYSKVFDDIAAVRQECSAAVLKVILETGELGTLSNVRRASWLSMAAGADFIKTSTGKAAVNATPQAVLVMLEAVRAYQAETGRAVGVKASGGIRTAKEAMGYLTIAAETAGEQWLNPGLLRFGASTLLTDLVMCRQRMRTGSYSSPQYVPAG
jgi:deoxyribose-phosphate aldolase